MSLDVRLGIFFVFGQNVFWLLVFVCLFVGGGGGHCYTRDGRPWISSRPILCVAHVSSSFIDDGNCVVCFGFGATTTMMPFGGRTSQTSSQQQQQHWASKQHHRGGARLQKLWCWWGG